MDNEPLHPKEGWYVLHLFYQIDYGAWNDLEAEAKLAARAAFVGLIEETRREPSIQCLSFSVVTPKADVGFIFVSDDLHATNAFEKRLVNALGDGTLTPVFSFLSLTERSEYTTSESEHRESLAQQHGDDAAKIEHAMADFRSRMEGYLKERLYPILPDWPIMSFYPMSKRRVPGQNWYALPFEERRKLMAGHAKVGRTYAGRIRQVITGSTGLESWEWSVTLFAKDLSEIKSIVYEMRFDPVSAEYADFGEFFIGLQMEPERILARLLL